jgi:hypothetical protein
MVTVYGTVHLKTRNKTVWLIELPAFWIVIVFEVLISSVFECTITLWGSNKKIFPNLITFLVQREELTPGLWLTHDFYLVSG